MGWQGRRVLVTGGASFIGSHLCEALVERGAEVRVADDLSSGRKQNLQPLLERDAVDFREVDLLDPTRTAEVTEGIEVVFHLAARHGGRGYIALHPVECSGNLVLDGTVFRCADRAGVEKVVFASSGCVYPNSLQDDPDEDLYLAEDLVRPPYDADDLYGWGKLMAELTLQAYHAEGRFRAVPLRYFTAYGPRCTESHAVVAMIARAFVGQDPFVVWGSGEQVRNWTYVDDVVEGTVLAAERVDDGTPLNLGTRERIRVVDAAREILAILGTDPELHFDPSMPTGPYNRVCDPSLAEARIGWKARVAFRDGIRRTLDWYLAHHEVEEVRESLEQRLTDRGA